MCRFARKEVLANDIIYQTRSQMDACMLNSTYKLISMVESSLPSGCWPFVGLNSSFTIYFDGSFSDFMDIKAGFCFHYF